MKKLKMILALTMIFVILASANVFATSVDVPLYGGIGGGGGYSSGHCGGSNSLTATSINAQSYGLWWGGIYTSIQYLYADVVYNGVTLGSASKLNGNLSGDSVSVTVARPASTMIAAQSYSNHQVLIAGSSWSTRLAY